MKMSESMVDIFFTCVCCLLFSINLFYQRYTITCLANIAAVQQQASSQSIELKTAS